MSDTIKKSEFQLCSVVSKENGESPIGSASTATDWVFIEVPLPWPRDVWQAKAVDSNLAEAVTAIRQAKGKSAKLLGIEPDKEYSQPDYTRVIHYRRPEKAFTQFKKAEYIVPKDRAGDLIQALFADQAALQPFAAYRQETDHLREMFVCTHGSRDTCCGQQGFPLYEILRKMNPSRAKMPIRAWRVSHIGGHKFSATLADFPYGHTWGHLEIPVLPALVEMGGDLETLSSFYRGWAGFTSKFAQIAERDIWLKEGWVWLDYEKQAEVLTQDDDHKLATVRLHYRSPDGQRIGYYDSEVSVSGQVQTLAKSGHGPLVWVDQYQVTTLNHVELQPLNTPVSAIPA
ncbi:MAG: sucrase ferredoxin [Chloroflexota bacterium]